MARNESERGYIERYAARTRELLESTDVILSCFADYGAQHVTSNGPDMGTSTKRLDPAISRFL